MKLFYGMLALAAFAMSSCQTYYMSSGSLTRQLERIDGNKIHDAYDFRLGLAGVLLKGGKNFYNGIDTLEVTAKDGKTVELPVNTQTSVVLTDASGRKLQLYFDSMFLRDSMVYGSKSHYITLPVRPMPVDSVVQIRVYRKS